MRKKADGGTAPTGCRAGQSRRTRSDSPPGPASRLPPRMALARRTRGPTTSFSPSFSRGRRGPKSLQGYSASLLTTGAQAPQLPPQRRRPRLHHQPSCSPTFLAIFVSWWPGTCKQEARFFRRVCAVAFSKHRFASLRLHQLFSLNLS